MNDVKQEYSQLMKLLKIYNYKSNASTQWLRIGDKILELLESQNVNTDDSIQLLAWLVCLLESGADSR